MQSTAESAEVKQDGDPDEYSFIRTEDMICLVCTSGESTKRGYLAAEGFGSHVCHLEPETKDHDACELWKCQFVIEDAMSVHAMYSQGLKTRVKKQSSRKILMYGHAVLLRHCSTKKLLRCLTTTSCSEKMSYDIGFTQRAGSVDESCWFIVRPASSQRSAGEKVRAGDDVYLVGVANERFLSAQPSFFYSENDDSPVEYSVLASFHQCVWSLHIVCSGSAVEAAIGHVNGGDVMRFVHRYRGSDVLTISSREYDKDVNHPLPKNIAFDVRYEKMSDIVGLRSLWRVELFQMRFGGGFVGWGQPFRLRHMATGKFLGISGSPACGGCGFEDEQESLMSLETKSKKKRKKYQQLTLISADKATKETTAFCFSKSNLCCIPSQNQFTVVDGMGKPLISFGDSEVYLVHCDTRKIIGCPVSERRHRVLSQQRKAIMQEELHRSFAFTAMRASEQEAKAASNIQRAQEVMRNYVHRVILGGERGEAVEQLEGELIHVLDDLCYYFRSPDPTGHTHDSLNQLLCRLKERQNLFRNQGMLQFTLTVIMKTTKIKSTSVQTINHKLYKLLAAMIRGNHGNCRAFATEQWLGEFMKQLSLPCYTHSVLDVIQCLLDDSPEVLNLFSPRDIATIVNILNTSGRDEKVMHLLSSLCVCHGVAMRDKQRLIYKHLNSCQDLLLQTSLQNHVNCVHPSVYIGVCDGSATYHKWYYEVHVTQLSADIRGEGELGVHFRVGWAHVTLFLPTPTSNSSTTTAGGVGDDVYSVGFDGAHYWVGGSPINTSLTFAPSRKKLPRQEEHVLFSPSHSPSPSPSPTPPDERAEQLPISVGDVIGCCLDLERGVASFLKNGVLVEGHVEFHHCCKNITPALSFSAGVSMVISLGGHLGKFAYGPPAGYAGLYEAVNADKDVILQPFRCLGDPAELLVHGPAFTSDYEAFVPAPIDTSSISLPDPVKRSGLQDRLAKNIHELWSKNKIDSGYCYGEVRNDDLKHNPCLKPFEELSEEERFYDYNMATQTLATLVVLGYQISTSDGRASSSHVAYQDLPPDKYRMSNGYIPQPLNLEGVEVAESLEQLVEKLAENAHNVWAVGRIQQGWSYGKANDTETKRNKLLVSYSKLDEATKKSNRDTAYESIRTICALGCTITPPPSSSSAAGDDGTTIQQLAREFSHAHVKTRTFRGQTCYKITEGKWYYEVELLTGGMMRIGWATPTFPAGIPLGSDDKSYAYDGYLARKWHRTSESFGQRWSVGDVVGCLLDIEEKTITYSLNGEILHGSIESPVAFSEIDVTSGLVPAITLFAGERAKMNFGHSEEPLRCSLATVSGFQSICNPATSLHYNIPLWYSAPGDYDVIDSAHHARLAEERIIGDNMSEVSKIRIRYSQLERPKQECLKLNFGVTISTDGVDLNELSRSTRRHTLPTLTSKERTTSSYKRPRGRGWSIDDDDITPNVVSYSIIVPSGQDPEAVFVGWTTAGFRYIQSQFQYQSKRDETEPQRQTPKGDSAAASIRYGQQVKVFQQQYGSHGGGGGGGVASVSSYSTAFMVCLSDLLPSPVPLRLSVDVKVTCVLDTIYGEMTFNSLYTSDVEGDSCANKRAVLVASPGTKLFPTAVITPMSEHVLDFDFAPVDPYQPLSSVVFKPLMEDSAYLDDPTTPLCPRRIKVLALTESCWRRQPMYRANYRTSIGSGGMLQVTTEKEPSLSIFITLPQEDRVMDILEVSEKHKLMNFHIRTLETYAAVCSHSNLELAKAISQRVNCKQLLECLKTPGMRSELKAAYLKLVTYLHLEHEVQTRLLMRGEFILPLSKCAHSVSLFPVVAKSNGAKPTQEYSLKGAMLPGICLGQSTIQHNITSSFSNMPFSSAHPEAEALVTELKELVFEELEKLLSTRYYNMQLLPIKSRSQIFVPLIEMLDNLLVMGVIQSESDIQRLLCLLSPERLAPSNIASRWSLGLLSAEVTSEEDMKLALCSLLQHLCDCQVQHRVESIVMFANGYVDDLCQEQRYRHDKYFMKNPKEFRCSPEQQLQTLLSFKHGGSRQRKLREKLEKFHHELLDHCGAVKEGKCDEETASVWRKLQTMMELLFSTEDPCCHGNATDHVTSLQKLITETMMEWAGQEIHNLKLIGQIFALLYRQFDEIHEVKQALSKTYIIDIKENDGRPNYDIGEFREAFGSLRLLMKVGMGKTEENLLRDSLKTIQHSELFYCHPHLLRQLGVHTILLDLMQTYLGICSKSSVEEALLTSRRKRRINAHLDSSTTPPVADCCRFLCNFARISQANQRALFRYLAFFLDHIDEYPDVMSYSGYTPLDVATATIKGNQELVLALEESHLEHVVQLLVVMTTNPHGSSEGSSMDGRSDMGGGLGLIHRVSFSFNYEWSPQAGQKCLEFLHAAVWVDSEPVQENAHVIVRLLIQHSECLGPALAGDAHGLYKVYSIAIEQLPFSEAELPSSISQSRETLNRSFSRESTMSSQSSLLSCSLNLTAQDVLTFYSDLLLLLAYCAAGTSIDHAHPGQGSAYSMQKCLSKQKRSAIARTRNILQNLIKTDDLVGILSLKFARGPERGVSPSNKEAAVLFLERAYGITSPELLLKLLTDAFLPDLKLALKLVQCPDENTLSGSLNRYLCCSVLPLLSHHSAVFPKVCSSHLHVVDSLLSHCFRLSCGAQLSVAQRENLTSFFINALKELHPQAVQKFMPRIISDIPHHHGYSVISYKLLSAHYEHFSHYYQSNMLDHTSLGLPSSDEKTYSALVVHRLIDTLSKNLPSCGVLLRSSVSCLKSLACALVPDCGIPNEAHLSTMYSTSITSYEPRPVDTSRIALNHKQKSLVTAFASYRHDCWILDQQNEGWSHGVVFDEGRHKDPKIKPFDKLSKEEQAAAKAPVVEAVKYALMKGWTLSQVKCSELQNLPLKKKLVCMMKPRVKKDKDKKKGKKEEKKKGEDKKREKEGKVTEMEDGTIYYEPKSVYDLSKVGMRINLLSLAERMAENAHNSWALELKKNDSSYASHTQFVPYELLDEARREELRTFNLDLLRYIKVSGYDITRSRLYGGGMSFAVSLDASFSSEMDPSSEEETKFCLQFFDRFLGYLSLEQTLDPDFYLKVLFPVMTSYLKQHRTYFMPSEGQRGHSFASREEKLSITGLFCQVMEFTRKNLDHLFPSLKKPSANILSPGEGGSFGGGRKDGGGGGGAGPPAETDQSWAAAKCILSLVKAIIAAMDVKGIVNGEEGVSQRECNKMTNFFLQATTGITLTTKSINKLDKCDAQFTFYCLQLLVPSLTALFRHVGLHRVGEMLIHGPIKGQCRYIFQNLVDMAMGTGPVYVGSSPLVLIGQCMGAFALAYPDPFLDTNLFGFSLQSLLDQLDLATREGVTCGNVLFVVDIIIPVLASYIIRWNEVEGAKVPETCAEEVLTQVLSLIEAHFCQKTVPWVTRIVESSVLLAGKCSLSILTSHLVPLMEELRERAICLWQDEHYLLASWNKPSSSLGAGLASGGESSPHQTEQEKLAEDYRIFVRDLLSVLPYLTLFLHSNHSTLSRTLPTLLHETSSSLFISVADIFHCWGSSQFFRRQLQMTTLQYKQSTQHMWHYPSLMVLRQRQPTAGGVMGGVASGSRGNEKKPVNLLLVVLEFLLPICDQGLSLRDRELVDWCKSKLGSKGVVPEDLKAEIMKELKVRREEVGEKRKPLARKLVKKFSQHIIPPEKTTDEKALHILSLARVKFRIQQVDKGHEIKLKWKQLLSQRKRKAIIGCFLAVPFFNLSKHRCLNMFLQTYCSQWLVSSEHYTHDHLTEELLDKQDYIVSRRREEMKRMPENERRRRLREAPPPDPLTQLLHMFKRIATSRECIDRQLYISYMDVLSKSVVGHQEDDEMTAEDNSTKAYILYSEEKARLMVKQAQLADRGAPAMVLLVLTAKDGKICPVVHSTLKLGIALLKEGNQRIQTEMLEQLKGIDVGFLSSIAKMIASCSVLDWNAYERYNKSEPVIGSGSDVLCKVLPDHLFTKSLFRFLQLLCEGHNTDFQNYLRTQAGNTTTVNIVISTVDYLLRLQESISDFYWHYTDYHTIDIQGRENFLKAFKVAKQVFRTLTEYIQGPCVLNQEALSRSRLWDAVSGFLHVFAVLQRKLYKDTSQVELLRELLSLQEEMFILLLSMLEGSAMSSAIGKLMVDMLIDSASFIEDIMTFFNMFVKLNDFSTAKAFKEFDLNKDGLISYREFEMAMKAQQRYTEDEIAYLMECADLNKDGLLDYLEFTERFYQPAANIGFHLCVLIVHLSDHLPDDLRLEKFKCCSNAKQLMEHFAKNMGCIEILGKSKRIERVYFEVKESRLRQWDEPHIRESRRNFLHSVELGSQKRKLQGFVSFCEDTIFEINHTDSISGSEQIAMETRALQHRKRHNRMRERPAEPFLSQMKETVSDFQLRHTWVQRLSAWLLALFMLHLLPLFRRTAASVKRNIPLLYKKAHQKIVNRFRKKTSRTVSGSDLSRKSTKRPQLKLNIPRPLPQIQINGTGEPTHHTRAQTTTTEHPPTLRHRFRGSLLADSADFTLLEKTESRGSSEPPPKTQNGEARRATISSHQPFLQRGISEERRGSLSHTPRAFKLRQLTLNYDRSKMKAPSQASEGTTPNTPMMDGLEQKPPGGNSQSADSYRPRIVSSSWSWSALLARHYSILTNFKLLVTIIINILLLTYRVEILPVEVPSSPSPSVPRPEHPQLPPPSGGMSAADSKIVEDVQLEDTYWAPIFLNLLALLHFALSAVLIASYWHFRVPLIIFKREKQVARRLEKMRLWITMTPLESWSDRWDSLVIGSVSFPRLYWDKQVKERVCENLRMGEEKRRVTKLLGMELRSKFEKRTKWDQFLETFHSLVDFRYQIWSLGVIVTDMMIIYHVLSCLLSFVGLNLNIFYFSIHLLDLILHFKRLRTVLYSVLHNRRQLAMTALLMFMVIYLYTVLAFNFFREFYRQSTPEGSQVYNCDSMFKCFVYHIDQGLRSGGGIADVLEPAAGDMLRLLFDITFFFLVIIMLLAIIQGLIIDAFGELRDKEESLTAEMQNKCFVCGLPKNEFDHVPHGFDNHTSKQHNMAHYMFFLLYLIKKKESEFSGQESYVWEMYLKHNWDFFPVGDCFHAQEERSGAVGVAGTHPQRRQLKSGTPQHSPALNRRTN